MHPRRTPRSQKASAVATRIATSLAVVALLSPLAQAITASSANAQIATTDVSVSVQTLDPGSTTQIVVDNPVGANAIGVGACGNADSSGIALPASAESDLTNCFGATDITIVGAGDTGSGVMLRVGIDGFGNYELIYEWTEPIGSNATTCISTGNYHCKLTVALLNFATSSTIETFEFPVVPDHTFLSLSGPVDAVRDGTVLGFTATGLGVRRNTLNVVATCGNADAAGVALPASSQTRYIERCANVLSSPNLQPGTGNVIIGGAVTSTADPFAIYGGTIQWVEPMPTLAGGESTCIEDGNFPCIVLAGATDDSFGIVEVRPAPNPTLVVGSISLAEGDSDAQTVSVPVTLDHAINAAVTVDWTTHDWTATSTTDFVPGSGTLRFAPGETAATINVKILGDTTDEFDEVFGIQITNPHNGAIGGFYGLGFVTILDDDAAPSVIPEFIDFAEGDAGTVVASVPVSLSSPSEKPITVDWLTLSNSATADVDFLSDTGQLTFAPGQTTAFVPIEIIGDTLVEGNELAVFATTNWVNSTPGGYFGLGGVNILEDEGLECIDRLLPGADLRGCDLSGEVIENVNLSQADLTDADLTGAQLIGVAMDQATIDRANLSDTIIVGSVLNGVSAIETVFDGSTVVNTRMVGLSAPGASINNAAFAGGSAKAANLAGASIQSTVFLVDDLSFATLDGITWGPSTLCPDNTVSGEHGDTCWFVSLQLRAEGSSVNDNPVNLTDNRFFGTFHPGFLFDAGTLSDSSRFGGSSSGVDATLSFVFDSDGDGELEHTYGYPVNGAPLILGTNTYCATALFASGDAVYGCDSLTVNSGAPPTTTTTLPNPTTTGGPSSTSTTGPNTTTTAGPTTTSGGDDIDDDDTGGPISPPASPPASPPISGDGADPGMLPLLSGPLGLMATASGLGLIFLVGSNRATSVLEGEKREDDEDDQ